MKLIFVKPIFNELSLSIFDSNNHFQNAKLLTKFARLLKRLDQIGFEKVLCYKQGILTEFTKILYSKHVARETRDFLRQRISKGPYVKELYEIEQGPDRIIYALFNDEECLGLGFAALINGLSVSLQQPLFDKIYISIILQEMINEEIVNTKVNVINVATSFHIEKHKSSFEENYRNEIKNGLDLIKYIIEKLIFLVLGDKAKYQIENMTGNKNVFQQIILHLESLNTSIQLWKSGSFILHSPINIRFSKESSKTLEHFIHGPKRDFPVPLKYMKYKKRFSLHTKLQDAQRLYFHPIQDGKKKIILIGYIGPHLSTVTDPT